MNKYQALQYFWSLFDWAAYNENTVPDDALEKNNGKYITYEAAADSIGQTMVLSASLWHKSTSWTEIHAKAQEVSEYIELHFPPEIPVDGGYVKIRKGTPFASDMADEDDTIRRVLLQVQVEFLTRY